MNAHNTPFTHATSREALIRFDVISVALECYFFEQCLFERGGKIDISFFGSLI